MNTVWHASIITFTQIPQPAIWEWGKEGELTKDSGYQSDYCELYLESYLRNKWPCHQEHTIYNSLSFSFHKQLFLLLRPWCQKINKGN